MNLMNQDVMHKSFGKGEITAFTENYLTVQFSVGEKKFIFPDVFNGFLSMNDPALSVQIQQQLDAIAAEKQRMVEEKQLELKIEQQRQEDEILARAVKKSVKVYPRANIAFKCNFCNGGQSENQVGFDGVCSDDVIHNNIITEHRTWCNSEHCACRHYVSKEISRQELDSMCAEDGFVCHESTMLRDWKALVGVIQQGEDKRKPMKLNQVQKNSLCILTTRNHKGTEKGRYIFAVFLVDETYQANPTEEGYVSTNSPYKIKLSPTEAKRMLFWNYHANGNQSKVASWSSGLHRYFDDEQAAKILRDIAAIKIGTDDEPLARQFYEYFCTVNGVDMDQLSPANGALKQGLLPLSAPIQA